VISAADEPIKGWLDNFNGPIGTYVGGGKGILRVIYLNPQSQNDYLPVDAFIKSLIIVTWMRGTKRCVVRTLENCNFMHNFLIPKFSSLSLLTNLLFANICSWCSIAEDNTIHVYNAASFGIKTETTSEHVQIAFKVAKDIPFEGIIWLPHTNLTNNYLKYYILAILLHILPALLIDGILKLLHRRPM